MALTNEGSRKKAIFLVVIFVAVIVVLIWWFFGGLGIWTMLKYGFLIFIVLGVVAGIVYIIYYLFFKQHRVDLNYINKQHILRSAKLTKPPLVHDLFVSGDRNYNSAKIGKITGFTRIPNMAGEQEDCISFKPSGALPFLGDEEIIRILPEQHSPLVGDVYLKGLSVRKLGEFVYLNQDQLDFVKIDETQKDEVFREWFFRGLSELKALTDEVLAISPEHQKKLESQRLIQLPSQQQTQQK